MTSPTRSAWRTGSHTINGFSQFCREWQPTETTYPSVLALHGSLAQSGMWIAVAEAACSIRMVCPDQRGFGLSEDPGGDTCADFAADAVALAADRLPGRYVLIGHSFACTIALEAARADSARVAAIALVDPVVRVGRPRSAPPTLASPAPPESFATLEDAARHFRSTEEGAWPDAALARFARDVLIRDDASGRWRFPYAPARLNRLRAFTASSASDYDLMAKAKDVHCPVLIFRGGKSTRFPSAAEASFLAAFSSRPKFVLCPASGHFPTATEPDIVIAGLRRFLEDIGRPGRAGP